MKKLVSLFLMLSLSFSAYSANQWRAGTGASTIPGSTSISDIDTVSYQNMTDPIDRLLTNFREGCKIVYLSASTLTVESGEIVVSNSDGSIPLYLLNPTDTTVTWSVLDVPSENDSTTYYVYAYQDTPSNSTFDIKISVSSSAPTGVTYYKRLGSFYNNSGSDIEQIKNDNTYMLIAIGTVAHAGTIPLPSGYTESQCKWMVSLADGTVQYGQQYQGMRCSVDSSRVVTAQMYKYISSHSWENRNANYIIVGYK